MSMEKINGEFTLGTRVVLKVDKLRAQGLKDAEM